MEITSNNYGVIVGKEPINDVSPDVKQAYNDTCAIKSAQIVLKSYGQDISEDQLRMEAMQHGFYAPGQGTHPEMIGNLLELHGLPVNNFHNANIINVINELAQGHEIICGVDSNELYYPGRMERYYDMLGINGADHAIVIAGVDLEKQTVIITDPGTGELLKEYPIPQFVDAAEDAHFRMASVNMPALKFTNAYGAGFEHLPLVGDMTYQHFVDNYVAIADMESRDIFRQFRHELDLEENNLFKDDNQSVNSTAEDIISGDDAFSSSFDSDESNITISNDDNDMDSLVGL